MAALRLTCATLRLVEGAELILPTAALQHAETLKCTENKTWRIRAGRERKPENSQIFFQRLPLVYLFTFF